MKMNYLFKFLYLTLPFHLSASLSFDSSENLYTSKPNRANHVIHCPFPFLKHEIHESQRNREKSSYEIDSTRKRLFFKSFPNGP